MTQSSAPWGIKINNDVAAANTSLWGSSTTIFESFIGTAPFGPYIHGFSNTALVLLGDHGKDVVTIGATTFGGTVDLRLFNGNNDVTINSRSTMPGLYFVTGVGNDTVLIDDATIVAAVYIRLGSGADSLFVRRRGSGNGVAQRSCCGWIDIDGELGVDTTNLSALALGALGFEIFVP